MTETTIREEAIKKIRETYTEKVWKPIPESMRAKDAVAADLLRHMAPAVTDIVLALLDEKIERMKMWNKHDSIRAPHTEEANEGCIMCVKNEALSAVQEVLREGK